MTMTSIRDSFSAVQRAELASRGETAVEFRTSLREAGMTMAEFRAASRSDSDLADAYLAGGFDEPLDEPNVCW